jgi:predicted dienelactone hydrolase
MKPTLRLFLISIALLGDAHPMAAMAANDLKDYGASVLTVGPYPVAHAASVWRDSVRGRDVPVRIDAPAPAEGKGRFPGVVFSPGAGESRDSYAYLGRYLASHGYVVVTVNHAGSDSAAYKAQGWRMLADPTVALARPRDLVFALDRLTAVDVDEQLLRDRVDPTRIAVAGHSLGSTTALALAGLVWHTPEPTDLTDRRVRAVIAMSPQLEGTGARTGRLGLSETSWDPVRVPSLVVLGSRDVGLVGAARTDPSARRSVFKRIGATEKYQIEVQGAEHHAFTETEPFYRAAPRDARHHGWIGAACTAFLDATLKQSAPAREWLRTKVLQTLTGGMVLQDAAGDTAASKSSTPEDVSAVTTAPDDPQRFVPVTQFVDKSLRERGVSGAGLLIVDKQGHTVYERYFGNWKAQTTAPIASASKWFAAATLLTLVDAGLVKLDDRVEQYLPEFRNKGKKSTITLRQTLSFTAGYKPHDSIEDDPSLTLAEVVRRIADMELLRDPGTAFIYGGLQMEIAGRVAEVVTGKPYRTVFEERVVAPLELTNTRIATLRNRNPRDLVFDSANPLVPGGIVTDMGDFRRFVLMLLNDGMHEGRRVLSPDAVAEMTRDQTGDLPGMRSIQEDSSYHYSLGGWYRDIGAAAGGAIISSEGAFGTSGWIYRDADYGVVFMTFARAGQMTDFGWRLKDMVTEILNGKIVVSPGTTPLPASGRSRLGGGGDAIPSLISQLDHDGNGALSQDEVPQRMRRLRQHFGRIDANRDGLLSAAELGVVAQAAQRGRNTITQQETAPEVATAATTGSQLDSAVMAHAYHAGTGPYAVAAVESVALRDERRNKDVIVRVTYPQTGGPFPILLFSHYSGGTKDDYQPLVRYWVSHGYVCIQPNHSDSPQVGGSRGAAARQDWQNRPRDLSFLVDALDVLAGRVPALNGKLDKTRIGAGGHYIGAYAANLLAGMRVYSDSGSAPLSFADPRITAVVLLSPQGTGQGVTRESWTGVRTPMFVMTGSNDVSARTGNTAQWRTEPYQYSSPGDKYLLFVEGLYPGYGGISGLGQRAPNAGPENGAHVAYTENATLAFWDAYLKDDPRARDYLRSRALMDFSNGAAELSWK